MHKIFLIRHGETIANQECRYQGSSDYSLSHKGKKQAQTIKKELKQVIFDKVFVTDLIRTHETAKIICSHNDFIEIQELRERHFGIWEDKEYNWIKENYDEIYQSWLSNPEKTSIPEAEDLIEVNQRTLKGLEIMNNQINLDSEDRNYLLVCHGGINRLILGHYLQLPLSSFWNIKQDNCCINIIELVPGHSMVSLLNYTPEFSKPSSYRY
ncbi:histidine phosphatase family protein [bacterium]|nr:histidine phosphatase family protein [bacterium]